MSRTYRNPMRMCNETNLELYLKDKKKWHCENWEIHEAYEKKLYGEFSRDYKYDFKNARHDYRSLTNKNIRTDNRKKMNILKKDDEFFYETEFFDKHNSKCLIWRIW